MSEPTGVRGLGDAPVGAVLFDYGLTLVTFRRPDQALAEAYREIAALVRRRGVTISAAKLLADLHERVQANVAAHEASGQVHELDHQQLASAALRQSGVPSDLADDYELVDEILDIEQRAWYHGVTVAPGVVDTLTTLRAMGLRLGLCSNASYRAASMHGQIEYLGVARLLDAATFSSEAGFRKPSQQIFTLALQRIGCSAAVTVMVGDKMREDVDGAQRSGLRAIRLSEHNDDASQPERAHLVLQFLAQLPGTLAPLVG